MKFCRNKYFNTFCSVVLIWSFLLKTTHLTEINGKLPDPNILNKILNEFIKPMVKSFSVDSALFRSFKETAVEKVVTEKIDELQGFLQDNDINIFNKDNNYMLLDNDETAIIEFLPKTKTTDNRTKRDPLKENLNEYKKIRQKIKKALKKDSVSEKTKSLILQTLDNVVKKSIDGRCNWKRTRLGETDEPYLIASKWKDEWWNMKKIILQFLASNPRRSNVPKHIEDLHMILKSVSKDVELISKKYKLQCEFVPILYHLSNNKNPNNLRNNLDKTIMEDDTCQNIVVCSNELRDFMFNFYKSLNDTTVSVLKNYAEMYSKEVNGNDVDENKIIISLLANISNDLEGYISEIFVKETMQFKLDEKKNEDSNIKIISDYIKNNINNVKVKIQKILRKQLDNIKEKIVTVIRDDIQVNLNVDLGNLEQEFLKRICTIFRLCNGRYGRRRQNIIMGSDNKNNMNVQLQLSFDDELMKNRRLQGLELPLINSTKLTNYVSSVNVTRTTIIFNSTQI